MSVLAAVGRRSSQPRVTATAPSHEELLPLVAAAAQVADHGALRPWRLIELRGDARLRLAAAFAEASGAEGAALTTFAGKATRASLLIAVVASLQPSPKVAAWEQEAVASGVGHTLSLLLDEAGWGVMWRSGPLTRSLPVHSLHGLANNEYLLGWLYVGGRENGQKSGERQSFDAERHLSIL